MGVVTTAAPLPLSVKPERLALVSCENSSAGRSMATRQPKREYAGSIVLKVTTFGLAGGAFHSARERADELAEVACQ